MLNPNRVLTYIKENLAFPFQMIELTDENILSYINNYSKKTFSQYFPSVVTIGYEIWNPLNKVPGKANEFYLNDELGLEVYTIKNLYFSQTNLLVHGHPPLGPLSLGELGNWALSVEVAGWVKQFSNWDYTFEFRPPNTFRISPVPTSEDHIAIEYEREHDNTYATIPNELQMYFLDLCLADTMIRIGRLRKKYADGLKTPFGDIPLSSEILDEGKELRRETIEKLTNGSLPNIVVDFG